jgi:hypothetical protein
MSVTENNWKNVKVMLGDHEVTGLEPVEITVTKEQVEAIEATIPAGYMADLHGRTTKMHEDTVLKILTDLLKRKPTNEDLKRLELKGVRQKYSVTFDGVLLGTIEEEYTTGAVDDRPVGFSIGFTPAKYFR